MATAKTQLPNPKKPVKSARKSAQTLKAATPKTTAKVDAVKVDAAKVVPINREDMVAQIETLKADLAELTSTLRAQGGAYVSDKTEALRATATAKAELAKDKYGEISAEAKDKYGELAADTEARIRANPLTAVAIAAGVGLLFGAMSRR